MNIQSTAVEKKRNALALFVRLLLSSPLKDYVAKIILFGSVRKGKANSESDVDILVLAAGSVSLRLQSRRPQEAPPEGGIYLGKAPLGLLI